MTDDIHHPADVETRPDDHQHAVEACEHALDALENGDNLSHAHSLLDEARAAVERAQHDDTEQAYRETAYDCYD
jgi:hypothetical protein